MLKKLKLNQKLLILGIFLTVLPLLIAFGVVSQQNKKSTALAESESVEMADADLTHIVENIYILAVTQQEVIEKNLEYSLNVAEDLLKKAGGVSFSNETQTWNAGNQYTRTMSSITLPRMYIGDTWLGKVSDKDLQVPLVDEVDKLMGTTCTVFQMMNPEGDMLRVATNVIRKNGRRAIGSFIPHRNPDGSDNPVIAAVKRGRTYIGRAYVVDGWYITAYEPIYDANNNLAGMIYVGIPQESTTTLRRVIMDTVVGTTGYVFVLDKAGNYVISRQGKRDGENIIGDKDETGLFFIKQLIDKATSADDGRVIDHRYQWKDHTDNTVRTKKIKAVYFKKWDWIICAGSFEHEFLESALKISKNAEKSAATLAIIIVVSVFMAFMAWFFVARSLTRPLRSMLENMNDIAQGEGDLTKRLEVNSRDEIGLLAEAFNTFVEKLNGIISDVAGISESLDQSSIEILSISEKMALGAGTMASKSDMVATAAEEMSANMTSVAAAVEQSSTNIGMVSAAAEEMTSTINEISQNTSKTRVSSEQAVSRARTASENIDHLNRSAREIGNVVDTINDISEQTNLLALNATIEAARAGEAGKGFAVVANEIKDLARQTAEATFEIKGKIENIQGSTQTTISEIEAVTADINGVNEMIDSVAAAVEEQSLTTREIASNVVQAAQGIQEISENVGKSSSVAAEIANDITDVNQTVKEMADKTAQVNTCSDALSRLSGELNQTVGQFKIQ